MWTYFLTNKDISKLEHSRNKELGHERLKRTQEKSRRTKSLKRQKANKYMEIEQKSQDSIVEREG